MKIITTKHFRLVHVVDWTPTLLAAVKDSLQRKEKDLVEKFLLEDWDGVDQWNTIVDDAPSKRTEFLYNIDPLFEGGESQSIGHGAIRYVDVSTTFKGVIHPLIL